MGELRITSSHLEQIFELAARRFGRRGEVGQLPAYDDRGVEIAEWILKRRGEFFEGLRPLVVGHLVDEQA